MDPKFDLNHELKVLVYDECIFEREFEKQKVGGIYHLHRLGSLVPLFLFTFSSQPLTEFFASQYETINYFSKIGNLLAFDIDSFAPDPSSILNHMLKCYGSVYSIVFCCNDSIARKVADIVLISPFLRSEVKALISLNQLPGLYLVNEAGLKHEHGFFKDYSPFTSSVHYRNALILQALQQTLHDSSLDWNWQYEQSDKLYLRDNLVMKNFEKWKATPAFGHVVVGTPFIPMKLLHDGDDKHNPEDVLKLFPDVGMLIDLSNDEGSYDKEPILKKGIIYRRIQITSKVVPSSKDISLFIECSRAFISEHPGKRIIVHCHYGYNRTGLMICAYLIEVLSVPTSEALDRFKEARPPGVKHQNYIDKLYLRYEDSRNNRKM